MTKHTQGPWAATSNDHPEQGVYGCGYRIAKMTGGEIQRDHANAHLIAAAPELLEALKWMLARVERLAPHQAIEGDAALYEIAAAMAAIAKAEGAV